MWLLLIHVSMSREDAVSVLGDFGNVGCFSRSLFVSFLVGYSFWH